MNVLVVMTDQQRWDALGALNPDLETPNLDGLLASGLHCTNAYTTSPECVPARATILTGRPSWAHGVTGNGRRLEAGTWTFVRALRENGWSTWGVGKHHFRPLRADHGYDLLEVAEGQLGEGDDFGRYLEAAGWGWLQEPSGVRHELYYVPQVSPLPDRLHVTTWTADRAICALEVSARSARPFYGVVSFLKPHPPFDPTVGYAGRYDPDAIEAALPAVDTLPPFPIEVAQNYSKWREETGGPLARTLRSFYYACVTQVDAAIGRVLEALDGLGLADETLVVFTSDHGEMLGDRGMWGKRSFLPASARVPLVLRWPGRVAPGTTHTGLVVHEDVAATVLASAGLAPPPHGSGVDILRARRDEAPRADIVGLLYDGPLAVVGVISDRWKWSYSVAGGMERLTDGEKDPGAAVDISGDPALDEVLHRMRATAVAALEGRSRGPVVEAGVLAVAPACVVEAAFGRNLQGLPAGRAGLVR